MGPVARSELSLAYNLYMPSGGLSPLEGINSEAYA